MHGYLTKSYVSEIIIYEKISSITAVKGVFSGGEYVKTYRKCDKEFIQDSFG